MVSHLLSRLKPASWHILQTTFPCKHLGAGLWIWHHSSMLIHHLPLEVDEEADPLLQGYHGCVRRDKLAVHHRVVVQYEDKQAPAQSKSLHAESLMSLWVHIKSFSALKTSLSCGQSHSSLSMTKKTSEANWRLTRVQVFWWSDLNTVDHYGTLQQPLSLPAICPQIGKHWIIQLSPWPLHCSRSAFRALPNLVWMQPSGEPLVSGEEPRHCENYNPAVSLQFVTLVF